MEISREQRLEIIKEWKESTKGYCDKQENCNDCKFSVQNKYLGFGCCMGKIEEAFNIIYPKRKTCKEDFLEKFPNAATYDSGNPKTCVNDVYRHVPERCKLQNENIKTCCDCWNQEMEEE